MNDLQRAANAELNRAANRLGFWARIVTAFYTVALVLAVVAVLGVLVIIAAVLFS